MPIIFINVTDSHLNFKPVATSSGTIAIHTHTKETSWRSHSLYLRELFLLQHNTHKLNNIKKNTLEKFCFVAAGTLIISI
jgi:ribosomal 50S subunit-associated protein YjgA (DUF615 family)